jgi:hypothetical protein
MRSDAPHPGTEYTLSDEETEGCITALQAEPNDASDDVSRPKVHCLTGGLLRDFIERERANIAQSPHVLRWLAQRFQELLDGESARSVFRLKPPRRGRPRSEKRPRGVEIKAFVEREKRRNRAKRVDAWEDAAAHFQLDSRHLKRIVADDVDLIDPQGDELTIFGEEQALAAARAGVDPARVPTLKERQEWARAQSQAEAADLDRWFNEG